MSEEIKNNEATNVAETAPVITIEQVKEINSRIEKLNDNRRNLEGTKKVYDAHMNDLENIKSVYGENSKQFENKKEIIAITDAELKKLEDTVDELSFKRSELKPYLDAIADIFDKERMAQAAREYHIEIGNVNTYKQLMDFCHHSINWTPKTAPALMTLVTNLEENRAFVRSKDFDGVIILRSGNVLALNDFMTNKLEGRGWNTAKEFLSCWANCGRNLAEAVRNIQKEYDVAREYATIYQNLDAEFTNSENDITDEEMSVEQEVNPSL